MFYENLTIEQAKKLTKFEMIYALTVFGLKPNCAKDKKAAIENKLLAKDKKAAIENKLLEYLNERRRLGHALRVDREAMAAVAAALEEEEEEEA